jgi:acyl-CoA thioesterase FadM
LLAQTLIRFVAPGRGGVEVEIEVVTTRLGDSSIEQSYRVREGAAGAVWCEAQAVLVIYDPKSKRSASMAPTFRAAVAAFEGLA